MKKWTETVRGQTGPEMA